MEQGTREWHAWRKQGIGSSEVAAILGMSPYTTALKVWEDKINPEVKEEKEKYIFKKGHKEEERVRAMLEMQTGLTFAPALVESSEYSFFRASLDGRTADKTIIMEAKLANKKDHENAKLKKVSDKYMAQIQYQLMVSRATKCIYCSWLEKSGELVTVDVYPDPHWQKKIFEECTKFWECVKTKTPPGVQDDDVITLKGLDDKIIRWKDLKQQIDGFEEIIEALRKDIEAAITHPKMEACGVTFTKSPRIGNVNYKLIPELKGVDLEKYRGASSTSIKFTIKE